MRAVRTRRHPCSQLFPYNRAVARKRYRDSAPQSAVLAGMLTLHRAAGTFQHKITRYIALNQFCKDKFIEGGLPEALISIKPIFAARRPAPLEQARRGGLFVGRLAPEKGLDTLIDAWPICAMASIS